MTIAEVRLTILRNIWQKAENSKLIEFHRCLDGDYDNSYRRNSNGKWIDSSDDVLSFVMQTKEQRESSYGR